jgi:2-dehydropantoate 2-reductase
VNVLVYGAGVIGCYLAHVLCQAGNSVSLLARGSWKETLEANGLIIHHHVQRSTTVDRPTVLDRVGTAEHYDAVFVVMQHQQMQAVLGNVAALDTPRVVLVGNNLSAAAMEQELLGRSATPKTVLFGFQATGGNREKDRVECVRWGGGKLVLGGLHRAPTAEERSFFASMFEGTAYRLAWENDMDGWYKSRLAPILPIAYLCYLTGCDLRTATRAQRTLMVDAAGEGFDLLKRLNVPIRPVGEDSYYHSGPKRALCDAEVFVIAKTALGKLCASDHCRRAVAEMESLTKGWDDLRSQAPGLPMPRWDALRAAMPSWETLHQIYDAQEDLPPHAARR